MFQAGYTQVYTGEGKGKSTTALGLALRTVCAGGRVYIGQFFKGANYAELKAQELLPGLTVEQFGLPSFVRGADISEDREMAVRGMNRVEEALESEYFDLVILDEINKVVELRLIDEARILQLIDRKPEKVELVLTGAGASQAILDRADLVTEMVRVKHYSDAGVIARKGIEY